MAELCLSFGTPSHSNVSRRCCTGRAQVRRCLPPISAAAPTGNNKRSGSKTQKIKRDTKPFLEEEIYNVKDGWKIKTDPTEKMIEIADIRVPSTLKQKLPKEKPEDKEQNRALHKLLKVMGGKVQGKKLLSPVGMSVRPMMEVVRGAVFNMLQARGGYIAALYPGKWLDLYSGTGSVGIEALSRGCTSAHFIELDPWVVSKVLEPNLQATKFMEASVIHMTRVETYLKEQATKPAAECDVFDYISVTPPYELVHYPTLMQQLSTSPLVGKDTFIVVEYPLASRHEMPENCGPLLKVVDRKYGRTHLAVYGPEYAAKAKL